jgi:acetyl esterase/lipase
MEPMSDFVFPGQELTDDMRAAVTIEECLVPGPPDAPDVRVLLYRPNGRTETLPLIVHTHGGAFGRRADNFPALDARLSMLGALVASVDYRSLPDHRFPAAPEDSYAAFCWAVSTLDIDPARVVVTGRSAGGALAAALTLMARDRHGPAIALQALCVPVFDDRCSTPSMHQFVEAPVFGAREAKKMWHDYLGPDVDRSAVSPYAAPARAQSLAGLPPAFVQVGDRDPLRDEGIEYAMRLMQEGVPVELYCAPGQLHGKSENPRTAEQAIALWHHAILAAIG